MLSGRCACNAVAYEVSDEFVAAYNCHCSNCRALRCDAASACRFSIGLRATGTSAFRMGRSSTSLRSSRWVTCSSGLRLRGMRFSTTFLSTTSTRDPDSLTPVAKAALASFRHARAAGAGASKPEAETGIITG